MPFKLLTRLLVLSVMAIIMACNSEAQFDLLIENARIVDVENGSISQPVKIGVSSDTIHLVIPMAASKQIKATTVIDANGQYLMPGLWDMHVHFRGGDSLVAQNKAMLSMFLDHGVTTVRDAGGDMTAALMNWRKDINQGTIIGPDIYTSGPKLDGENPAWPGSLQVTDAASAKSALDSLETLGVDFIKIYDGSLSEEAYYHILREAGSDSLKITGHVPMDADLLQARELGLDGIEHLYYLLAASAPNGDSIRALKQGYRSLPLLLDNYDAEVSASSFSKLAESPFYVTPTLHITKVLDELRYTDHSRDSLLQYMGKGVIKSYTRRERLAKNRSDTAQYYTEKRSRIFGSMVFPLHKAGAILLAGSDCGAFNSYVYPGASLQEELVLMVAAGLTPAEALSTSVINGPEFFGQGASYGKIAKDRVAHMILLPRNPLEDISAIREVSGVIKDGVYRNPGSKK